MKIETKISITTVIGGFTIMALLAWLAPKMGDTFFYLLCTLVGALCALLLFATYRSNGQARPEKDLPTGQVFEVAGAANDYLIVLWSGRQFFAANYMEFWGFNVALPEVTAGKKIVYLDDPNEYRKHWHDQGVIMILSQKGRAKAEEEAAATSRLMDLKARSS